MKKTGFMGAATAVALFAFTGAAAAQTGATATAELNIRAGPGTNHPVVGVIGAQQTATLHGCLQDRNWCSVSHAGVEGWAHANYLAMAAPPTAVAPGVGPGAPLGPGTPAAAGMVTGIIAGAIIGGPAGAAIGGAAGAIAGGAVETITPAPAPTLGFAQEPSAPARLEAPVVAGTASAEVMPETHTYAYHYINVDGEPVLVP